MAKKKTEKKVVEKAAEPKVKTTTYRHWNGERYETRTREE